MSNNRDRAAGWKHAKLSGHENEFKLEVLMQSDGKIQKSFLERIGKANEKIVHIDIGGLCEKDVDCIFVGEKTKSKTDMHIVLSDDSRYNISIKKSEGGQVYLIGPTRFINGFEKQYSVKIPDNIKRAISLFWGTANDVLDIVNQFGTKKSYETRKHRLVGDTLCKYDKILYFELLSWFKDNMYNVTDFCFSKGLAKNSCDWANVVWYKNELGENEVDKIFLIEDLCKQCEKNANIATEYGSVNGGTTIQLPFGFVQWHSPTKKIPGDMQFHHKYYKLLK